MCFLLLFASANLIPHAANALLLCHVNDIDICLFLSEHPGYTAYYNLIYTTQWPDEGKKWLGKLLCCVWMSDKLKFLNLSSLLLCSGRLHAKSQRGASHTDKMAKIKKEVCNVQFDFSPVDLNRRLLLLTNSFVCTAMQQEESPDQKAKRWNPGMLLLKHGE